MFVYLKIHLYYWLAQRAGERNSLQRTLRYTLVYKLKINKIQSPVNTRKIYKSINDFKNIQLIAKFKLLKIINNLIIKRIFTYKNIHWAIY